MGGPETGVVRSIFDALDACVYVADLVTYEVLFVNQTGGDLFGDIVGRRCWEAIQQGETGPCSFCTNDRIIDAEGRPTEGVRWEFQNSRNGRWYLVHDRAIPWDDGRLVRLEIAFDITEQRKATEQIKKNRALLNDSQRLARIGSWELDLTTNELTWTDEIFRLFGIDANRFEATYEAFLGAVHPDDRKKVDRAYTDSLISQKPYSIIHRVLRPDGALLHGRGGACHLFEEGTVPVALHRYGGQDITKEIQRQTELRHALALAEDARAERERFISVIAYDVKAPVATLATYLDLLSEKGVLPDGPAKGYLPVARRTAQECARLLDGVIHASTLFSDANGASQFRFFDGGVVAFTVVSGLVERANIKGVALRNRVPRRTRLYGDPVRYTEVLTNLVENAIHFTPQDGTVTVSLSSTRPVGVAVADTGVGMPPEMVSELFLFGARVVRPGIDGDPGPGVGLPSNREMMERMGGNLTAHSTVGAGSTFTLTLPPVEPRVLLRAFGEREGISVARMAREAGLATEEGTDPTVHLILTKVIDGKDGILPLREIRMNPEYDQILLIALGPRDPEVERRAIGAGADHYLAEPVTPWGLDEAVDRLLLSTPSG